MFLHWNGPGATLNNRVVSTGGFNTLPPIMAATGPYLLLNSSNAPITIATSGEFINGTAFTTFVMPPYASAVVWPTSIFGTWAWAVHIVPISANISKTSITSGTSSTVAAGVIAVHLVLGAIAAYNLTTPAAPFDGQVIELSTTGTITTLTITANTGSTVQGGATATIASFAATQGASFTYDAPSTNWMRRY